MIKGRLSIHLIVRKKKILFQLKTFHSMIEIGMQHQKEDFLIPGTCVVLNIRLRNDQIARQVVYRAWQTYTIPGIILDKIS